MSPRTLSRRKFLGATAAAAASTTMGGGVRLALAGPKAKDAGTLIFVALRGGMDGLSAVVPLDEPRYYDLRPTIAVPAGAALPLDGRFGLHPALDPLLPFWGRQEMAVVNAVGIAQPQRSHFAATDDLDGGIPGTIRPTSGWLSRHLSAVSGEGAFRGVAVGGRRPLVLAGPVEGVTIPDLSGFGLVAKPGEEDRLAAALQRAFGGVSPLDVAGQATVGAEGEFRTAQPSQVPTITFPSSPLGSSLRQASQLVRSALPVQAICVESQGWDMHDRMGTSSGGQVVNILSDLGRSLAALATDLDSLMDRVTIVVVSEFGRRVAENGSRGTDHGWGGALLAMGRGLQGGKVYGEWPGLGAGQLANGDLAVTTDIRDVLGELVVRRHGGDASAAFPGHELRRVGIA